MKKKYNKDYYQKNKEKWNCRTTTLGIIQGYSGSYIHHPIPEKFCKRCGSEDNLEVHHEVYPKSTKEIRKAIDDRKIYYLCRECHGRKGNHKI